ELCPLSLHDALPICAPRGARHASARHARPPADQQAQGLQRRQASARGAESQGSGDQVMAELKELKELKEFIWGTGRRKSAVARVDRKSTRLNSSHDQ